VKPPVCSEELMFSVESADYHFVDALKNGFAPISNSCMFTEEECSVALFV